MASNVRVTHRTDTRGTVNAEYRGLYELAALDAASKAGVPDHMLHPSGWNGDENDLTGYFAEQIYRLGEIGFTAPDTIAQLAKAIEAMQQVCRTFSVDPREAIPYDSARFKRELNDRYHNRETTGSDSSGVSEAYDAVMADWGAPAGPSHDSHGHGKTPDGWKCLSE
jgi:hypothetical protein